MAMTVRRASPGDAMALAHLNSMVQALHVDARPDLFVPVVPSQLVEWFNAVLASPSQRVWLAEIDGKPAGYLLAAIQDRPATPFSPPRRWCEIDQPGVHEEMRGRGVARALVSAALD
jgi:GNAT superfamily N-acetyltransferase